MKDPVDTTTTWADDELEALDPVEAELPDEPELPEEADTCWPTARSTEATVPPVDDTRVAPVTAVCAAVTWFCADAMLALSSAIWVADAPAVSSVASWA